MKRKGKRLLSLISAMIIVLTTIITPSSVAATEKVDISKSGSASLSLELPAASDSVNLYRVAEYDSESKIVMSKEAENLKVTIDGKESEAALGQKAQTLAGKIKSVAATGKTDAKGTVKFDKLKLGYYLVIVDKCESDSARYEIAPAIVGVPAVDKSALKYDVAVKLKGQEVKTTPAPATTTPKAPTSAASDETTGADDDSTPDDSSVAVPSQTPSPSVTESPEPTESGTPSPSVTESPEPTESGTPSPSVTESPEPTESGTQSPSVTEEPEPTESGTPSPSVTEEPEPTESGTPSPSITEEPEPTESGTPSPSVTEEPDPTDSVTPTPDTESDDSDPDFPPDDSSIPDITVTPDPNLWQMSVTKYWIDKNNLPLPADDDTIPDSLSIQIWKKVSEEAKWEKVELVDLTAENDWTYSWMAPDDGATWTVTEDVTPIGFTQMTIKQSKNATKKTLAFKVTNMSNADVTPAPVQLSIVKYWKDKNGNDLDDADIGVEKLPIQIYRKEKDATTWKLFRTAELTADTAWEYHWGAANDGASWTVTERVVPEGYILETPIKVARNKTNTRLEFRVTNISTSGDVPPTTKPVTDTPTKPVTKTPTTPVTKTPTTRPVTRIPTKTPTPAGTISLSVEKKWQSASGTQLTSSQIGVSSLTVDIYRKRPGATSYTKVDTVELLPSNNWTHSWTAQDDGSTWTVSEPRVPTGYTKVGITQARNRDKRTWLFTITNKKTGNARTTGTGTPRVTSSSRTTPNTGDNQNIWIPLLTLLGAAVVLVVLVRKRPR